MVVVTHNVPEGWPREGSPFSFATDGIESAIEQAKALAGGKAVAVNGGTIASQCLDARLLDEIWVDLVPVLLGGGTSFFDQLKNAPVELEGPNGRRGHRRHAPALPRPLPVTVTRVLAGSCRCGAVRYEVADEFVYAANCHCSQCRAATGSAFKAFSGDRAAEARGHERPGGHPHHRGGRRERHALRRRAAPSSSPSCATARSCTSRWDRWWTRPRSARPSTSSSAPRRAWFEITDDLPQFDEHSNGALERRAMGENAAELVTRDARARARRRGARGRDRGRARDALSRRGDGGGAGGRGDDPDLERLDVLLPRHRRARPCRTTSARSSGATGSPSSRSATAAGTCSASAGRSTASISLWRGRWAEAETCSKARSRRSPRSRPPYAAGPLAGLAELRRRQGRAADAAALLERAGASRSAELCRARLALDAGGAAAARPSCSSGCAARTPGPEPGSRPSSCSCARRSPAASSTTPRRHSRSCERSSQRDRHDSTARIGRPRRGDCSPLRANRARPLRGRCSRTPSTVTSAAARRSRPRRRRIELAATLAALGRVEHARTPRAGGRGERAPRARRRPGQRARHDAVTPREREVLALLAEGLTNRQIAERLVVSEHTVHRHVTNILRKLDLPTRSAAAATRRAPACSPIGPYRGCTRRMAGPGEAGPDNPG